MHDTQKILFCLYVPGHVVFMQKQVQVVYGEYPVFESLQDIFGLLMQTFVRLETYKKEYGLKRVFDSVIELFEQYLIDRQRFSQFGCPFAYLVFESYFFLLLLYDKLLFCACIFNVQMFDFV